MNHRTGRWLAGAFALAGLAPASGQYAATDLNPLLGTNSAPSMAYAAVPGYQAGSATFNGQAHAYYWQNSAASALDITPALCQSAVATGISTIGTLAGRGTQTNGATVALYWTGPSGGAAINFNPIINGTAAAYSQANGIFNTTVVGMAGASSTNGYAYYWPSGPSNPINLHPSGFVSSTATACTISQQVGYATLTNGASHAMLWSNSAASARDLNPTNSFVSYAEGVSSPGAPGLVVGYIAPIGNPLAAQAYVWSSSTGLGRSIQPAGYTNSFALGVSGANTVGYGTISGQQVALYWSGTTTNTVINLSASLPAGATNAVARAIDSSTNIVGYAMINGQNHAFLWQPSTPPAFTSTPQNLSTTVGILYNYYLQASGRPAPGFAVSSGSVPPGIALSTAGVLSGIPTNAGTYSGVLTATNGMSPAATQNFSIVVNPTPVQGYTVAHSFIGGPVSTDGIRPQSALVQGSDGNLYGLTTFGGSGATIPGYGQTGSGTVYRLSPGGGYSVVHNFGDGSVSGDGAMPVGTLVEGPDGTYYGVTGNGGAYGYGSAFRVTPQGVVTILHSFPPYSASGPHDGSIPGAGLILASDGNFYGTTIYGGSSSNGTLFRLSPAGVCTILHNFRDGSVTNDGQQPAAALVQGTDGNLYGTTAAGGSAAYGTLFQMTLQGTYTLVRSFADGSYSPDLKNPGALVQGTDGNFYGTAVQATTSTKEVAFKLTPQGAPTLLHVFGDGTVANDGASSGSTPAAGLILGQDGNFYGTTDWGGQANKTGSGIAFKMTPAGAMTVLHVFFDGTVTNDGVNPEAPLCQGYDGNLYGSTAYGGTAGNGSAFRVALFGGQANPVVIASTPPLVAPAGSPFDFVFSAQGSPAPVFSVTGGSLPPGLSLSSSGEISGTPDAVGTYTVTISAGNGEGTAVSQTFTLDVVPPDADTPVMPPLGLAVLGVLLAVVAAGSLPGRNRLRPVNW